MDEKEEKQATEVQTEQNINSQTNADSPQKNSNEYLLSALEAILINKQIPSGFKLECEEVLIKEEEEKNKPHVHKKHKKGFTFGSDNPRQRRPPQNSTKNNTATKAPGKEQSDAPTGEKKSLRQHKPTVKQDLGYIDKDVIKGKSNPLIARVSKQCEKGLMKIKKHPSADFFFLPKAQNAPSLSQIEKNIRNYKYKSIYEFIMELRKIWCYYFSEYSNDPEVFPRIFEMTKYSEEVYEEMEASSEDKNEYTELSKKLDSLDRDLRDMKGNHQLSSINITKRTNERGQNERPMTIQEKQTLKKNINLLPSTQTKGIVTILADTIDITNKKYLEFEIDSLPNKKLRELEKYVKNCLKKDKREPHVNNEKSEIEKLRSDLEENKKNQKGQGSSLVNTQSTLTGQNNGNNNQKTPNKTGALEEDESHSSSESDDSSSLTSL